MSFTDVLLVRGATYLLAAINYNVGQGAIVYFVHKSAGTTIMRGVATILLVLGINCSRCCSWRPAGWPWRRRCRTW